MLGFVGVCAAMRSRHAFVGFAQPQGDTIKRLPLPLPFALGAALLAALFVLLPVERQTAEYTWEPAIDGERVPLLLIERTPDLLELTFPCELADGEEQQLFVTSRSPDAVPALVVSSGGSRVVVEVPEAPDEPAGDLVGGGIAVAQPGDCTAVVRYDRAAGEVVIEAPGDRSVLAAPDGTFELTGLHWTGDTTEGVRAEVHTSASSMVRNSLPQRLVLGAIVLLALASLLPALIGRIRRVERDGSGESGRQGARRPWWRPRADWWRLHPSEWAILLVAVTVALVDLPRADDGRILARARILAGPDLGANVSNLFENRIVPQRWLYEWVLGTSLGWSSTVLVIRLLPVIAIVAAWMLLRRRVLPGVAAGPVSVPVLATAWTVFAVFAVAWTATLRPEPLVILLTVVVLATTASWPAEPRVWPSAVVVGAVGLAAATHVAGLAAAFAALPAAARAISDLRRSAAPVLTGVAWGAAFGVIALFLGSNLSTTFAAATTFGGGAHSYGPLDSLRYLTGIENSTAPMMLATGLGILGAVAALASAVSRLTTTGASLPVQGVVLGAALSPFALLLTPSKWLWHLAVLAPVAVVGWTLIARRIDRGRGSVGAVLILIGAALALLTTWAMRPVWNARMLTRWWRDTSLRELSPDGWADRLPWLVGAEVRWWVWLLLVWAVLFAALAVVRLRGLRSVGSAPLATGLVACFLAVSVVQLTPPVVDAVRAGGEWTFVRQSVVGLVSTEASCGVPAATPAVVQRADASGDTRVGALAGEIAGHSGVYLFAPCHESMRQQDGVWQVPGLLMGELTHDQRRAAREYDLDPIGCNSFPQERTGESLCFFELVADGDPLTPTAVRWGR